MDRLSFENVRQKWVPQIQGHHHAQHAQYLLLGLKTDMLKRGNPEPTDRDEDASSMASGSGGKNRQQSKKSVPHPVTSSEGQQLCAEIGAVNYLTCSSMEGQEDRCTLEKILLEAVLAAKESRERRGGKGMKGRKSSGQGSKKACCTVL